MTTDYQITEAHSDGKCTLCRKAITAGEEIVWLQPAQLATLNALGMSLKVFRRAHTKCLPPILEDEAQFRPAIEESTSHLMELTDPKWPKDHMGFNAGDAGFARRYLDLGCPREGTWEMARRLVKYMDTQLGGQDRDANKVILEAVEEGKKTRKGLLARLRRQRNAVAAIACGSSIQDAAKLPERRPKGIVGIDTIYKGQSAFGGQTGLLVTMDHPKYNATHGVIKDQLKSVGATWDGENRGWLISADTLAAIWGQVFTEAKVAVSDKARAKLTEVAKDAKEGLIPLRKPGQVLVTTNGRVELKVELDAPWNNPDHGALKDRLKRVGASWDKATGAWWIGAALVANNYDYLWGEGSGIDPATVTITDDAQEKLEEALEREALSNAASLEDANVDTDVGERLAGMLPEGLKPYPYQLAGAAFVDAAGGRALIGDQMGLGKTIQAILWLLLHPEARPAVLVVPAVVSTNWVDEINKWAPGETVQRIKTGKQKLDPKASCYVVTYDLARRRVEELKALAPKALIFDECHYLKNYKAQRTKAMLDLVSQVNPEAVIGLSGTPILNRPVEFYTTLKMLRPADYASWKKYVTRYCGAYRDRFGWQIGGATNTEELSARLRDTMVRRTKDQVLKELPAKTRTITKVEVPRKELNAIRKTVKAMVDSPEPGAQLAAMTWERHETGRLKAQAAVEWVREYHAQGEPVLVFAHHQDVLDELEAGCKATKRGQEPLRVGRIDLNVSADKRGALVKAFQAGDLDVMLLGIESGGVGITLTRASNVMFVERAWTPSSEEQAEDRAHRIGQERAVTIRYLVADGTIDNYISELIESKREVVQRILDGEAPTKESLDIRSELLGAWLAHHGLERKPKAKRTAKAKKSAQRRPERQGDTNSAGGGGGVLSRPANQVEMRW